MSWVAKADIVKPALVEISVFTDGHYSIEIRASIEALLTGINSIYKNTTEAPHAQAYDDLRILSADDLRLEFEGFHQDFTQLVSLQLDQEVVGLKIISVKIPEPGYTKVPRISVILIEGSIGREVKSIRWYYPERFADNAVRVRQVNQADEKWHWSHWQWLRNDQWSEYFSLDEVFHQPSFFSTLVVYAHAGYRHILPKGLDHILFILAIFLLSVKFRALLWQVTMFTLAHSITFSLAMYDVFTLPAQIVEPLIALSIAFIAIENIYFKQLNPSRLWIVFAFGLLHGMGFASMLADFGMPTNAFASAIISFNVGVELGQLSIILMAYWIIGHWFKNKPYYRSVIVIPLSSFIAVIGLFWTYERLAL